MTDIDEKTRHRLRCFADWLAIEADNHEQIAEMYRFVNGNQDLAAMHSRTGATMFRAREEFLRVFPEVGGE